MPLTIEEVVTESLSRTGRWHRTGLNDWTPLEWAGATAGEIGESCNAAKKLRRLEDKIQNLDARGLKSAVIEEQAAEYREQIAHEAADAILYAILLCLRVGHDPATKLIEVFNAKSIQYGFPERIGR